jgi:hypothetical protein
VVIQKFNADHNRNEIEIQRTILEKKLEDGITSVPHSFHSSTEHMKVNYRHTRDHQMAATLNKMAAMLTVRAPGRTRGDPRSFAYDLLFRALHPKKTQIDAFTCFHGTVAQLFKGDFRILFIYYTCSLRL